MVKLKDTSKTCWHLLVQQQNNLHRPWYLVSLLHESNICFISYRRESDFTEEQNYTQIIIIIAYGCLLHKITGKIFCLNYSVEHCHLTSFVSLSSVTYIGLEVCCCLKLIIALFSTRPKAYFFISWNLTFTLTMTQAEQL